MGRLGLTRRELLKAGAGAGALLLANPRHAFAATDKFPTSRKSRLFPGNGTFVAHSDLHNHTLLSDGATPAEEAFSRMRAANLDVAALTDHANIGKAAKPCSNPQCNFYFGIDEASWARTAELADASNAPGSFVAMRGFEWSSGTLGHVNVWFTEEWVDPLVTEGQSYRGLTELFASLPEPISTVGAQLAPVFDAAPETATMSLFYDWLRTAPGGGPFGGGDDGIAGFNHPGEYGNFEGFAFEPDVVDRIVSCEALNMDRDFLFWRRPEGDPEPLNACLNAGWRVGMLGVSDEHEAKWSDGKRARGGLWLRSLSRDGVREAMVARRMFATFVPGLRLDASANGVQMGNTVGHRTGPVRFELDLDAGPAWYGRRLRVQVLRPGTDAPVLAHEADVVMPRPNQPVITVSVPIDVADGRWALLRITDPTQPAADYIDPKFRTAGRALAYASPFWFDPDKAPVAAASATAPSTTGPVLPATGRPQELAAGALGLAAALAARGLSRSQDLAE